MIEPIAILRCFFCAMPAPDEVAAQRREGWDIWFANNRISPGGRWMMLCGDCARAAPGQEPQKRPGNRSKAVL